MKIQRFNAILIAAIVCFFGANMAIWHLHTRDILISTDSFELSRMGYFKVTPSLTSHKPAPTKRHWEMGEFIAGKISEQIDILTIGDSFSNGGTGYYYQDILSEDYGYSVLNVRMQPGNGEIETILTLLEAGWLERIQPKAIIIQRVGRDVVKKIGSDAKPISSMNGSAFDAFHRNYVPRPATDRPDEPIRWADPRMMEVNYKAILAFARYRMGNFELSHSVRAAKLDRKFFTNPGFEDTLLFFYDDLLNIPLATRLNVANVAKNLNQLGELLDKKQIRLYFLPMVDKLDLYHEYVTSHQYPSNPLFDLLNESLGSKWGFIDSKAILKEALKKGETDLYWLNDTHWTWKGQAIIAREIDRQLKSVGLVGK